jgi:3-hydroxyacyl-[acyl-carrier-protein] dehydratase
MSKKDQTAGAEDALPRIEMAEILRRIPHRYPFLLIDRAEDYKPHQSITGIKCVTVNEPFFVGHFPGNPVMPGC